MVFFSNCKINIGLYITGKRQDGYHNLETIFFPVPVYDVLELHAADQTDITILGQSIPGAKAENIILKAWQLLKNDFPALPNVHFYLLKNIPTGAGLGAGSANGAFALIALNKKFQLNLNTEKLLAYALALGSDCPFFILNQPCFASGRGEVLELVDIDLSAYKLVIVNPGVHVSTPWAFSQIQARIPAIQLKQTISRPVATWKECIKNDFEEAVIKAHPELAALKQNLYQQGADFAIMSGSGSTFFALFRKEVEINFSFPDHYFVKTVSLSLK
ncbi:MAG TPA: 4-(cytidine 5'-diphospho)-2-C-methyl-D-erythritol kinase [Niabella sp.]|nr:4-(cytidine 5'-diphospho)-2-C-methyl-D-erythritol kinase [Niabella sp.]HQX21642.1 4-(cytidine 5'-diphospho)-2-C-methyl-D-erythritol kinase [Niabella sp.]HQX42737.1 4-(cytidine 5'-diphospho)-2-C-methyl-D-erythritol kinase [Niabella sp.]HRC22304.1 4-(cytidine 5'-diphospho)-2-C-methyl-D-erythritol kinase [Niabella sp.]